VAVVRHLEHRAGSTRAGLLRGAEEIAAAVHHQAAIGVLLNAAREGGQGGDGVAVVRHLEHRPEIIRSAPLRGAEEIAAAILRQAGGAFPVAACEGGQGGDGVAVARQFVHRPETTWAALHCGSEEIAAAILY
jgi:NAD(P)H-hydrate repair Nnr-like enzyme with NAD(P)H-hydrate epimerase domain